MLRTNFSSSCHQPYCICKLHLCSSPADFYFQTSRDENKSKTLAVIKELISKRKEHYGPGINKTKCVCLCMITCLYVCALPWKCPDRRCGCCPSEGHRTWTTDVGWSFSLTQMDRPTHTHKHTHTHTHFFKASFGVDDTAVCHSAFKTKNNNTLLPLRNKTNSNRMDTNVG